MKKELNIYTAHNFISNSGILYKLLDVSYQIYGRKLHTAPIVLVNHALTGNSTVTGENGWWNKIVGDGKVIDTAKYTVIAIDILGNGNYKRLVENYSDFNLNDIAKLHIEVLKHLKISNIYAIIGGSIGGGLGWEMNVIKPDLTKYLIPIASHWQSTDWIIGHTVVQEKILNNSVKPLEDARQMAMLFYRTPESFKLKFNRGRDSKNDAFKVENWLDYHGKALTSRFRLKAYRMVNHLLSTIDITNGGYQSFEETVKPLKSTIVQIGIDSDLFFKASDNKQTKLLLDKACITNKYHEIKSVHGHDAFLIEHNQLTNFLKPIFK